MITTIFLTNDGKQQLRAEVDAETLVSTKTNYNDINLK